MSVGNVSGHSRNKLSHASASVDSMPPMDNDHDQENNLSPANLLDDKEDQNKILLLNGDGSADENDKNQGEDGKNDLKTHL